MSHSILFQVHCFLYVLKKFEAIIMPIFDLSAILSSSNLRLKLSVNAFCVFTFNSELNKLISLFKSSISFQRMRKDENSKKLRNKSF